MGLKPDKWIRKMALEHHMIVPFAEATRTRTTVADVELQPGDPRLAQGMSRRFPAAATITEKVISYGVSSYGYDARLADNYKVIFPGHRGSDGRSLLRIDPKHIDPALYTDYTGPQCVIPPNSMILGRTVEYFRIPRNVTVICVGKSTLARAGLIVNVTPLEASWEGYVTIEISNTTPYETVVYANEGIMQLLFLEADEECEVSYADKKGKYQNQNKIELSKL